MRYLTTRISLTTCSSTLRNSSVRTTESGEDSHLAQVIMQSNYSPGSSVSNTSAGERVTLSGRRLRAQCLPDNSETSYARVTVDGTLAGHAFACRWLWQGQTICWVTQLVVRKEYRDRGLAKGLLGALKEARDDVYGIMSSHPAACLAAATTFGCKYNNNYSRART